MAEQLHRIKIAGLAHSCTNPAVYVDSFERLW